jgi:uncharacterized protein (UPF0332 family)
MTDKQTLFQYRLSQAEATLNDGRIILVQGGTPRSAVNRAYYAVFYCALALFLKTGIAVRTSKHSGIIGIFDKEFIIPGKIDKKYSHILHFLFDDRQEFDYKEQVEVSADHASAALKNAEDFISAIKLFLQNMPDK